MTKAEEFYAAQNKLAHYDQETNNLMLDAMEFKDAYNANYTLPEMVYLLRKSFKERKTRHDVLGKYDLELYENEFEYDSNGQKRKKDPARGFCMVSSYLIYSMTGGDKVWELYGTPMHWWLVHKQSHTRFDITHTQFGEEELRSHYFLGKPVKYLNFDPMFYDGLEQKAHILAQRAGLE